MYLTNKLLVTALILRELLLGSWERAQVSLAVTWQG